MGILSISGPRFCLAFVALLLAPGCGAGDLSGGMGPGGGGSFASGGSANADAGVGGTGGTRASGGRGGTIGTGGRTIGAGGTTSTGGTISAGGSGSTDPLLCTTVADAASCTNGTVPEINLGQIAATACHDQCQTALPLASITTGCWVLATDLNCYCRSGVLNPGGTRPGGSCTRG
jgi:hypothetical protein